jgi:catechol 2,3-dioxygenase-like lactoylglutathione lyase family enzyme
LAPPKEKKMRFKKLNPILTTDDMDRSVRFYVDVLGFTCGMQTPGYSNLYRDEVRIMLGGVPHVPAEWEGASFTGQLYIDLETAEEVDELWEKLKDRAKVAYPVQDLDYGAREFGIYDDNGYSLAFGAPSNKN